MPPRCRGRSAPPARADAPPTRRAARGSARRRRFRRTGERRSRAGASRPGTWRRRWMTSPSISTSSRSPALRPSFLRASLGTAIWCLVLILTLSISRMIGVSRSGSKGCRDGSRADAESRAGEPRAGEPRRDRVGCGGGAPRAPVRPVAARRPAPDAGHPPARVGRSDDALLRDGSTWRATPNARGTGDAAAGARTATAIRAQAWGPGAGVGDRAGARAGRRRRRPGRASRPAWRPRRPASSHPASTLPRYPGGTNRPRPGGAGPGDHRAEGDRRRGARRVRRPGPAPRRAGAGTVGGGGTARRRCA